MDSSSAHSPATRKEREALLRQEEILAAAESLFAENGYHGTAMEQVAARAEFATGTLYRYFKNKEDLYLEILRRKLDAYLAAARAATASQASPAVRLRAYLRQKFEFFNENAGFLNLYITEFDAKPGPRLGLAVPERCAGLHSELFTLLADLLREGDAVGEFDCPDAELAASAINGLANQVLLDARRRGPSALQHAAEFIPAFVESGILAKNRKSPPAASRRIKKGPAASAHSKKRPVPSR